MLCNIFVPYTLVLCCVTTFQNVVFLMTRLEYFRSLILNKARILLEVSLSPSP
jgi:hypothetical protein